MPSSDRQAFYLTGNAVYFSGSDSPATPDLEQVIPSLVLGWERRLTRRANAILQLYVSPSVIRDSDSSLDELTAEKYLLSLGLQAFRDDLEASYLHFSMNSGGRCTAHREVQEEVIMHRTKLARISALALLLFLPSLAAFAEPPCGCNYCQRFPERSCAIDGTVTTCAEFLIVALCPAAPTATSADALSSEDSFLAALSGPTQEPAGCVIPTS